VMIPSYPEFDRTAATGFLLKIFTVDGPSSPGNWTLSNVQLAANAPEQATWAMMLLGFAGLGYVGYRRARSARTVAA
jgi:hypothetical protein